MWSSYDIDYDPVLLVIPFHISSVCLLWIHYNHFICPTIKERGTFSPSLYLSLFPLFVSGCQPKIAREKKIIHGKNNYLFVPFFVWAGDDDILLQQIEQSTPIWPSLLEMKCEWRHSEFNFNERNMQWNLNWTFINFIWYSFQFPMMIIKNFMQCTIHTHTHLHSQSLFAIRTHTHTQIYICDLNKVTHFPLTVINKFVWTFI